MESSQAMGKAYSVTNTARWLPILAGALVLAAQPAAAAGADLRGGRGRRRSRPDPRRQPRALREVGADLAPSDLLRTGSSGRIDVACSDGTRVTLGPDTEINLGSLVGEQDQNGSIGMSLHRGIARFLAPVRTWGTFNVFGPVAVASVRSTEWIMETPKQGTNVFVLDGVVAVQGKRGDNVQPVADLRRRRGRGRHHGRAQEVGRQAGRRRAGEARPAISEIALAQDPWQAALALGFPVPDRRDRHRLVASRRAQRCDGRARRPPARSAPRRARADQGARRYSSLSRSTTRPWAACSVIPAARYALPPAIDRLTEAGAKVVAIDLLLLDREPAGEGMHCLAGRCRAGRRCDAPWPHASWRPREAADVPVDPEIWSCATCSASSTSPVRAAERPTRLRRFLSADRRICRRSRLWRMSICCAMPTGRSAAWRWRCRSAPRTTCQQCRWKWYAYCAMLVAADMQLNVGESVTLG